MARFLWHDIVVTYRYNRHLFGARSSPTCANFALQKCAQDNAAEFLYASQVAQHSFYMDDRLIFVDFRAKAIMLAFACKELTFMLANSPNEQPTSRKKLSKKKH